jgi:hypothetical protein
MDVRIIDLDGSITEQRAILRRQQFIYDGQDWAPGIRLACSFGRFRRFKQFLATCLGTRADQGPYVTLYGSGDFHHVSLALLGRLKQPFNLLVIDNHPDWMRGLPFLHCGTWLYHAAKLPLVRRVFHVGGDVDFDNGFRWLAPWPMLRTGKITVFPAIRRFERGQWAAIDHEPLRSGPATPMTLGRIDELLWRYRFDLGSYPLYISVDKDVMRQSDAIVNWDSGHLELAEVLTIVEAFGRAAQGRLAGMDLVGDWSPVRLAGVFRQIMHLTEHPSLTVDATAARRCNERANSALLNCAESITYRSRTARPFAA